MAPFSRSTIVRCRAPEGATVSTCAMASAPCAAATVIRSASSFMMPDRAAMHDLFDLHSRAQEKIVLGTDAVVLRRFTRDTEAELLAALRAVVALAPFRHMVTPGGYTMSVAMTNCGAAGWVTDRTGYRYDRLDPESGQPWPALPSCFLDLAVQAATKPAYPHFVPHPCLINPYAPCTRL